METQTQSSFHEMNKSSNHVEVKKTNSTKDLFKELISSSSKKKLIVSSIYKQYRINESNFKKEDLDKLANKKIVFIFDEAHRTTFGDMYTGIIKTLKNAVIFGFTGTPIVEENSKNGITSYENFGPLIHKYTMKNAIDDKKVLGFNCEYVIFNYDFKNLISSNYDNNFELSSNESKIIHTIYPDDNEIRNEKRDFELLANNLSHKKNVARHILNHW
ncbi:Type-1 restriction enzyme R protein, partial [Metamycoplasma alkalescens]